MQFSEILLTFFSIFISGIISFAIVYIDMNKKLTIILEREYLGVLNKEQAKEIICIYIDEIKRELDRDINEICNKRLEELTKYKDNEEFIEIIRNTIFNRYKKIREASINKFSKFHLVNKKNVAEFITHIDREPAFKACEELATIIANQIIKNQSDIKLFKEVVSAAMSQINLRGKNLLLSELNNWYS